MPDAFQSPLADKGRLLASVVGVCGGLPAILASKWLRTPALGLEPATVHLLLVLILTLASGFVAALLARKTLQTRSLAIGIGARLGIRSGVTCALIAGGVLVLIATSKANSAATASLDRFLRSEMWQILLVSLASLLPSVVCGFVGGMLGGRLLSAKLPARSTSDGNEAIPWLKWANLGIVSASLLALAAPLAMAGKAPLVDPPPPRVEAPKRPSLPPPFHYEVPQGLKLAGMGEIQADFSKTFSNVESRCPIALSPDGVFLAYGDSSRGSPAVGIYDLHRFEKIASWEVGAFPVGSLAWSPDQKSIACTIGDRESLRIWILKIATGAAVELPRPPGRDVPGGELYWWQEDELAFFPDDEAPLCFDLQTLALSKFEDSSHFKKLDETAKRLWLEGSRSKLPDQPGWTFSLRTIIKSAVPPPRRQPAASWKISGRTVCAFGDPKTSLAFALAGLGVDEGDSVVCAPDGSKVARIMRDQIEVTYMKKVSCPNLQFEVTMPLSFDDLDQSAWGPRVDSKELCMYLCSPLKNPLNDTVVGPDYEHIHGIAQLVEWKGQKATFIVQTHDGSVQPEDVAATLHYWVRGEMSEWMPASSRHWWSNVTAVDSPKPDHVAQIESPRLLALAPDHGSIRVGKVPPWAIPPPPVVTESEPRPAQPSSPGLSGADVRSFLAAHHDKASRGDVAGMAADYSQVVDFLDKGRIPRSALETEESAHRQKWPKGSEKIVGEIVVLQVADGLSASYTIEFYNENAAGDWHRGQADLTMSLKADGDKLSITSQRAKVYGVTDGKGVAKPVPKNAAVSTQPQGVAITVPKPCFISTTQAKDLRQIEITDQISFVNGITWHRTYREMSAAGKVINTCRAIYGGSGGIAQDRGSARIYVKTQEWDQTIRGGTFTGVCQRSAESLVGKAFQFQFTQSGMIEAALGTSFRLQK